MSFVGRATGRAGKKAELPDGKYLSRADNLALKRGWKQFYAQPGYTELMGYRNRWLDDVLKKTACGVIRTLRERGIELFVVGQNKGQKQEINLGATQNRKSYNLAHSRLLAFMKSAAQREGILLLTTEESYTSQASFANNAPLRKYEKQAKPVARAESEYSSPEKATRTKSPGNGKNEYELGGKRSGTNRHVYRNEKSGKKPANWRRNVHADLNGAFNILRKVFAWFGFNPLLTFSYDIFWMSPKRGLVAMKNLEAGTRCPAGCA